MIRAARILLVGGIVATVLGLSKVHARYVAVPPYSFHGSSRFVWSFAYMGLLLITAYGFGLPDLPRSRRGALATAIAACVSAALAVSALQLLVGDALLPRFVVFGSALVLIPYYLVVNEVARGGRRRSEDRDRVLMVTPADEAVRLADEFQLAPERNALLVAQLDPSQARGEDPRSKPLVNAVLESRASVVVLDRRATAEDQIVAQAASLHEAGIRVRSLGQFYEEWLGKFPLSELERSSLFFDIGELHRARYGRLKRIIDFCLASLGLMPLVLVTPLVVLGNLVANRGPLLFRQERVGKNGRRIVLLKFRTMRADGMVPDGTWTAHDDPRVTRLGKVLRTSHVDELPQVINILRGELAVVGPRPEQPKYVAELQDKLPFYDLRHLVRPGLTGWAQVKYGYAGDERDALEKLQYEFFYLRNQSLTLDARIVGRTIRTVLGRAGR